MKTAIDVYQTQKAGNSPDENEDASWPPRSILGVEEQTIRIAISDGATGSASSGIWSKLLVKEFGKRGFAAESLEVRMERLAQVWKRAATRPNVPWYITAKLRHGAFAAFVGLELREVESVGLWSCVACGDSVLFHMRCDQVYRVFPKFTSSDFTNAPHLLGTTGERRGVGAMQAAQGEWLDGDYFYLMTDALARWYLTCIESQRDPWRGLPNNHTFAFDPTFADWIALLLERGEVKNDDCTLIVITPELS